MNRPSTSPPTTRPPRRPVVVRAVDRLTPRFIRVVVAGGLADWPEPGPAAHTKLFIDGALRTYTVRAFDRAREQAVFDVYLHDGNGPAARWAQSVRPGGALELGGRNRSTFAPDDESATYLFAGDSSALPAIATCLEALPAAANAIVIACGEGYPLGAEVEWAVDDDEFVAAIRSVEADRAWIACEAGLMRRVRSELLDRYPRERLSTRGYWKRGEANHPDHDTGDDE
ncbi:MAG TPA: siderophore-interacting protein [Gaiellaceae bacterium]|nr:siderophore-interacting protein [Gaiellaceae bacterium]